MIAEVDADGSGNIDFIEFLNMMSRKIAGMKPQEQVKDAFDLLDTTGVGQVSVQFLMKVCCVRLVSSFLLYVDSSSDW